MTQAGSMTAMSKEMQDCVTACMSCHSVCEETMSSCMQMGGQPQMQIMRALIDCSEMTRMCADMMMRRSPMSPEMCAMQTRQRMEPTMSVHPSQDEQRYDVVVIGGGAA
ncbi:hypothetical protein ABZT45_49670, partial [Streptomyces sp. NPDC005356]